MLSWQENHPPKDVPPEWMWPYHRETKQWFKDVRARNGRDDPDEPELEENDYFNERVGR